MKEKSVDAQSKMWGHARQAKAQRSANDFYPTPRCATIALIDSVKFDGEIWEPACGDGAISRVLREHNYVVVESDLRDDPMISGAKSVDFLGITRCTSNIVTNPPFSLAHEFIEHALECVTDKVAMLLKLNFLESERRFRMFKKMPLSKVLVISNRLPFFIDGRWVRTGAQFCHAWYIFDKKNFSGETKIDWTLWKETDNTDNSEKP